MFKLSRIATVIGVAALSMTVMAPAQAQGQGKKIGLAVANLQAEFFNMIKQSVEAYGKEKGYTFAEGFRVFKLVQPKTEEEDD